MMPVRLLRSVSLVCLLAASGCSAPAEDDADSSGDAVTVGAAVRDGALKAGHYIDRMGTGVAIASADLAGRQRIALTYSNVTAQFVDQVRGKVDIPVSGGTIGIALEEGLTPRCTYTFKQGAPRALEVYYSCATAKNGAPEKGSFILHREEDDFAGSFVSDAGDELFIEDSNANGLRVTSLRVLDSTIANVDAPWITGVTAAFEMNGCKIEATPNGTYEILLLGVSTGCPMRLWARKEGTSFHRPR